MQSDEQTGGAVASDDDRCVHLVKLVSRHPIVGATWGRGRHVADEDGSGVEFKLEEAVRLIDILEAEEGDRSVIVDVHVDMLVELLEGASELLERADEVLDVRGTDELEPGESLAVDVRIAANAIEDFTAEVALAYSEMPDLVSQPALTHVCNAVLVARELRDRAPDQDVDDASAAEWEDRQVELAMQTVDQDLEELLDPGE